MAGSLTCPSVKLYQTKFDDQLRSAVCNICNVSLTDDQWLQASLPVRNGGLGLRRVPSLASSAFLASAAALSYLPTFVHYYIGLRFFYKFTANANSPRASDSVYILDFSHPGGNKKFPGGPSPSPPFPFCTFSLYISGGKMPRINTAPIYA